MSSKTGEDLDLYGNLYELEIKPAAEDIDEDFDFFSTATADASLTVAAALQASTGTGDGDSPSAGTRDVGDDGGTLAADAGVAPPVVAPGVPSSSSTSNAPSMADENNNESKSDLVRPNDGDVSDAGADAAGGGDTLDSANGADTEALERKATPSSSLLLLSKLNWWTSDATVEGLIRQFVDSFTDSADDKNGSTTLVSLRFSENSFNGKSLGECTVDLGTDAGVAAAISSLNDTEIDGSRVSATSIPRFPSRHLGGSPSQRGDQPGKDGGRFQRRPGPSSSNAPARQGRPRSSRDLKSRSYRASSPRRYRSRQYPRNPRSRPRRSRSPPPPSSSAARRSRTPDAKQDRGRRRGRSSRSRSPAKDSRRKRSRSRSPDRRSRQTEPRVEAEEKKTNPVSVNRRSLQQFEQSRSRSPGSKRQR